MSDRLNELRRQRDLVKQHLDWLDAQIAAASGPKSTTPTETTAPRPASPAQSSASVAAAEDLLQRYGSDARDSASKVKLGCWIAFASSFVVLGLAIAAWFILRTR